MNRNELSHENEFFNTYAYPLSAKVVVCFLMDIFQNTSLPTP